VAYVFAGPQALTPAEAQAIAKAIARHAGGLVLVPSPARFLRNCGHPALGHGCGRHLWSPHVERGQMSFIRDLRLGLAELLLPQDWCVCPNVTPWELMRDCGVPDEHYGMLITAPGLYAALTALVAEVEQFEARQQPCKALDDARAVLAKAQKSRPWKEQTRRP
jgi:hypothetical protein